MSKQIIPVMCGNRDKCKYVCVSIDILDHLLRIMAGELSAMGYPRWTPWCRSCKCMSVPWPCPWVAPDPVSVGGCRPPPAPCPWVDAAPPTPTPGYSCLLVCLGLRWLELRSLKSEELGLIKSGNMLSFSFTSCTHVSMESAGFYFHLPATTFS